VNPVNGGYPEAFFAKRIPIAIILIFALPLV